MKVNGYTTKRNSVTVVCLLFVILTLLLSGCTQATAPTPGEDESYPVYCYALNEDATNMYKVEYRFQSLTTDAKIAELLQQLNETDEDKDRYAVIPKSLRVEEWVLSDAGELNISFNGEYKELSAVREAVLRTGVVLTLTQLMDVRSVSFTVNGEPLKNRQDEPVGPMTAAMYANRIGEPTEVIDVKLCFVNGSKTNLTTVNRRVFPDDYEPMEKYLIEFLIGGPTDEEVDSYDKSEQKPIAAIPKDTRILHVITKNSICYVDFSSEFMNCDKSISPIALLHSVADTLIRNSSAVDTVVITVEGKTLSTYRNIDVPTIFRTSDLLITE